MASLHRSRQWLEVFKFGVYVGAPVATVYVLAFGTSGLLEKSIEDRAYVVYPPEGPAPPNSREVRESEGRLAKSGGRGGRTAS